MSRLADALLRAAAQVKPEIPSTPVDTEVAETPFASPWDFSGAGTGRHPDRIRREPAGGAIGAAQRAEPGPGTAVVSAGVPTTPSVRLDRQLAMNWPQPFAPEFNDKLVVMPRVNHVAVQQFRSLAASLEAMQAQRGLKVVMFVSANAGEGKTLTAVNLALTLSELHRRRVLLVDTDLRAPRLHHLFRVSAGPGFCACLRSAEAPVDLPVVELTRCLSLLPAGQTKEGGCDGLVGSERARAILDRAALEHDWVVLDTPAISAGLEVQALAPLVGGAILVIQAGRTSEEDIDGAIHTLGPERLLGVTLNRADDVHLTAARGLSIAAAAAAPLRAT